MMILGFIIIMFIGFQLLLLIRFVGKWYESSALSFLLGFGVLSFIYFLYSLITDRVNVYDFWSVTIGFLLVISLLNHILGRWRLMKASGIKIYKTLFSQSLLTYLSWFAILVMFVVTMIYASFYGVYTSDSIGLYDFRSKAMLIRGTLSVIKTIEGWYTFPLFTSEINLFLRFMGGNNPAIFYPIMYLAFGVVFYSILRLKFNAAISSLGTFLMYSTPLTLWQSRLDGMTNLPYTIFFSLSLLYLFKAWQKKRDTFGDFAMSSIFLALLVWTRMTEPLWIVPILLALWVFWMKKGKKVLLMFPYLFPFIIVYRTWLFYIESNVISVVRGADIVSNYVITNYPALGFWQKIWTVSVFTLTNIFNSLYPISVLFIVILLLQLLFFKFTDTTQSLFLFIFLAILSTIYVGVLFFSINFTYWEDLEVTLSRLSGILSPTMWIYVILFPRWKDAVLMFKKTYSKVKPLLQNINRI